jgi:hypothetical protein
VPGPGVIETLDPAPKEATLQPNPVPINNCPFVGTTEVPVPPTTVDSVPKVIFSAERSGIRPESNTPEPILKASRVGTRSGLKVPAVILDAERLGISSETRLRKEGAVSAPDTGPAKILFGSCERRDAEKVPVDVIGDPLTPNTESNSRAIEEIPWEAPDTETNVLPS